MCDFCKKFNFNTIGVENYFGHPHVFLNSGGDVKPEARFTHCPMCGRPLTDVDFVKPEPGCPLGKKDCVHAPAQAYKCLYREVDACGRCLGYEVK